MAAVVSPKYSRPEVSIAHYGHLNYWIVRVRCKDRPKLFFDTVCTLADLNYDVYHGAIDSDPPPPPNSTAATGPGGVGVGGARLHGGAGAAAGPAPPTPGGLATQLYYIRPRFGDLVWDSARGSKLRAALEAAITRRFPRGLKVHVQQMDAHALASLTRAWKEAGLCITRAKVRAYAEDGHTLYVMDQAGGPPDPAIVQAACARSGGRLMPGVVGAPGSAGHHHGHGGVGRGLSPPGKGGLVGAAAANAAAAAAAAEQLHQQQIGGGGGEGGSGGAGGAGAQPAPARFYYAFLARQWDGSPSSVMASY
jgi:hypothetical protein